MNDRDIAHLLDRKDAFGERFCQAAIDSRQVDPKTLFFALAGKRVDGHDFLANVKDNGGVAAVVSKRYCGPSFGLKLMRVDDVKQTLHQLAKVMQQRRKGVIIGVTGTVGKTTVKEFIATLLQERFCVAKTPGNANSQLGLPLALINQKDKAEVFVLEMGMSLPGELSHLVSIAPPTIGVLTHISLVHAENFAHLEAIAKAKCELFKHPQLKRGFFCAQALLSSAVRQLTCDKVVYSFALKEGADYFFEMSTGGFVVNERGELSPTLYVPFSEPHLLENVLAAIGVARDQGLSWEEIKDGMSKLKPYRHRFEKIEHKGVLYVDDSYNASPSAFKAALTHLPKPKRGGKTIAALGAMKELGPFCEKSHREVGKLARQSIDYLLCLGSECQPLLKEFSLSGKSAYLFIDLQSLDEHLKQVIEEGDVVFIKGASALKMWRLVEK